VRVGEDRVDALDVCERGVSERLVEIRAVGITDRLAEPAPSVSCQQAEVGFVLGVHPDRALRALEHRVWRQRAHRGELPLPVELVAPLTSRLCRHSNPPPQIFDEACHPGPPYVIDGEIPRHPVERPGAAKAPFLGNPSHGLQCIRDPGRVASDESVVGTSGRAGTNGVRQDAQTAPLISARRLSQRALAVPVSGVPCSSKKRSRRSLTCSAAPLSVTATAA